MSIMNLIQQKDLIYISLSFQYQFSVKYNLI